MAECRAPFPPCPELELLRVFQGISSGPAPSAPSLLAVSFPMCGKHSVVTLAEGMRGAEIARNWWLGVLGDGAALLFFSLDSVSCLAGP